jgi:selenocysteine lyase/cysteine desulfurase
VRVIGPAASDRASRVSTVSFRAEGVDRADIVTGVDGHNIGTRSWNFYSHRLIDALGLSPGNGVVCASMVHYNTLEEVDRLIDALDPLI